MDKQKLVELTLVWLRSGDPTEAKLLFCCCTVHQAEMAPLPEGFHGSKRLGRDNSEVHVLSCRVSLSEAEAFWEGARLGDCYFPVNEVLSRISGQRLITPQYVPAPVDPAWFQNPEPIFLQHLAANARARYLLANTGLGDLGLNEAHHTKCAEFLTGKLGFDLMGAHNDWLGGAVWCEVDPLALSTERSVIRRTGGNANGGLKFVASDPHADLNGVRVTSESRWPGLGTVYRTSEFDQHGVVEQFFPDPHHHIGSWVTSASGQLIKKERVQPIIRNIGVRQHLIGGQKEVHIPKRGRRPEEHRTEDIVRDINEHSVKTEPFRHEKVWDRVSRAHLRWEEERRQAEWGQHLFSEDMDAATQFVLDRIKGASDRVIFVDPYFNAAAFQRFVHTVQFDKTKIDILTSKELASKNALQNELAQLARLMDQINSVGTASVDIRLMRNIAKGQPVIHDRFLISDGRAWSVGSSFETLGHRLSFVGKVSDWVGLQDHIRKEFDKADPVHTVLEPSS